MFTHPKKYARFHLDETLKLTFSHSTLYTYDNETNVFLVDKIAYNFCALRLIYKNTKENIFLVFNTIDINNGWSLKVTRKTLVSIFMIVARIKLDSDDFTVFSGRWRKPSERRVFSPSLIRFAFLDKAIPDLNIVDPINTDTWTYSLLITDSRCNTVAVISFTPP